MNVFRYFYTCIWHAEGLIMHVSCSLSSVGSLFHARRPNPCIFHQEQHQFPSCRRTEQKNVMHKKERTRLARVHANNDERSVSQVCQTVCGEKSRQYYYTQPDISIRVVHIKHRHTPYIDDTLPIRACAKHSLNLMRL